MMPARWSVERAMTVRRLGVGPDVLWLHGLGEHSASFDTIAAHPALAGFTHVLPDYPGCGRSAWPDAPGDLDALADRFAAWIGDRRPALIGHSMGGALATLIAERVPVRAVIDVEGNLSGGDCTFSGRATAGTLDDFLSRGFEAMRDAVYEGGRAEPGMRGYHAALTLASPHVLYHHARHLVALSESETLATRLVALRVPVLYIAGTTGSVCPRSHALLAQHAIAPVVLAPAGHWVFLDQPDAFATAVANFLRAA